MAPIDELHRHRDLRLYRTWSGKISKRGGQIIAISTAGEPGSEFEVTREEICRSGEVSRNGRFTRARSQSVVLHDCAVAEDGDVDDMAEVKSANPFSGITVESLAAKRSAPTMTLAHWRRFCCNLPTRSEMAAIHEKEWFDPSRMRTTASRPGSRSPWALTSIGSGMTPPLLPSGGRTPSIAG
jgi:hypothetical protein